jgi:ABC-2 type transport system permease protein
MSERHRLHSVLTIAYLNGVIPIRTQPLYLINLVASPLSFLFFITLASKGTLYLYGVSGGLLLTVLSIGTSLQTDMSHYRQDLKWQDVMVASPVEAPIYVTGMALSEFLYSLPGVGLFVVLIYFGGPVSLLGALTILAALVLIWAFASALGFTLATYFDDVRETWVFAPLISMFLTVLPPVYYPISYIPAQYQWLAYLSPTTYAADLIHSGFGLSNPGLLGGAIDWAVLIGFTLGLLGLAAWKARWRDP